MEGKEKGRENVSFWILQHFLETWVNRGWWKVNDHGYCPGKPRASVDASSSCWKVEYFHYLQGLLFCGLGRHICEIRRKRRENADITLTFLTMLTSYPSLSKVQRN